MTIKERLLERGRVVRVERVELDGELIGFVRKMTSGERADYRKEILDASDKSKGDGIRATQSAMLLRTICEEDGTRSFTDDQSAELDIIDPDDADALFVAANRLNTRTEAVADAKKN